MSKPRPHVTAMLADRWSHAYDPTTAHREPYPLGSPDDRRVDTNDLTVQIHPRATTVPLIDSCVRLNKVREGLLSCRQRSVQCPNYAQGDGWPTGQAKGVTNGDGPISHTEGAWRGKGKGRERSVTLDTEDGQVSDGVDTFNCCAVHTSIISGDLNATGASDDMVVGDYIPVRMDDGAGPGARNTPAPKEEVPRLCLSGDVDHGGPCNLHDVCHRGEINE